MTFFTTRISRRLRLPRFDFAQRHRPVLFVGGNLVYSVLVFLFPIVMIRFAAASEYARLSVYISITATLMDLANLGLGRGLQQIAVQNPPDQALTALRQPLQGVIGLLGGVSLLLTLLLGLSLVVHPAWFEHDPWILVWLWLSVLIGLTRLHAGALLYGLRRFGWFVGLDVAWAALRLPVAPLAWRLAGMHGFLMAQAALWLVVLAPALIVIWRTGLRPARGPWRRAYDSFRYFWRMGLWMHVTAMTASLARALPVLLMAWFLGRREPVVGFLYFGLSLLVVASAVLDSVFLALYPEKARAAVEGRGAELGRWADEEARALGYLLGPLTAAALWALPLLVRALRPDYHDLGRWLGPIMLALPARAMATPLIIALQAGHQARRGAAMQSIRLALDLACLFVGLFFWRIQSLTPILSILAGEWLATLLLFALEWRRTGLPAAQRVRTLALMLLLLCWFALLVLTSRFWPGWAVWSVMTAAWFAVLPCTPLIRWRELRDAFIPTRIRPAAGAV